MSLATKADEGYSRNVPYEGYSRNVPDEGYSRNVPDEGYSRNVPDEGYSRNVPDRKTKLPLASKSSNIDSWLGYFSVRELLNGMNICNMYKSNISNIITMGSHV
jgi:hypothetical protein